MFGLSVMASPDVFRSSPRRVQRESQLVGSSSPDLPPLHNILSQKPSNPPPLKGGSQASQLTNDATATFAAARSSWKSAQAAEPLSPSRRADRDSNDGICDADDSIEIVKIQPKRSRKLKERKQGIEASKTDSKKAKTTAKTAAKDKPWKKFQSKANSNSPGQAEASVEAGAANPSKADDEEMDASSSHRAKAKRPNVDEPLCLEPAMARRKDWTPPTSKVVNLDSGSLTQAAAQSSESSHTKAEYFKNLLEEYACPEREVQLPDKNPDDDAGFMKKRKLIELVATKDIDSPLPAASEKAPGITKAPKKKARTITGLATAAYKMPTQADPEPALVSLHEQIPDRGKDAKDSATETMSKAKTKAKPRKRTSKTTKKKEPPPMPILFSPGTALKQAADQNYVFGTSSQLAREQSPTLLRDIQTAMRNSNLPQVDITSTPISSDTIDTPERSRLWGAGARDPDGALFDIEIIDLVNDSTDLPTTARQCDTFDNSQVDVQTSPADESKDPEVAEEPGSFVNLSDLLSSKEAHRPIPSDDGLSHFSDSELSVSTNIQQQKSEATPQQVDTSKITSPLLTDHDNQRNKLDLVSRPSYELYTGPQLAKEIKSYGFKPLKRRDDMIALLDQCWQSKSRIGQGTNRTFSSLSSVAVKSTSVKATSLTETSPKRPRGRPRKAPSSSPEPQEPPPSAQPELSPKKPRGRPRKDAESPSKASVSKGKMKSAASPKRTARASSKKKAIPEPVLEIPDSASEDAFDPASSPRSCVEDEFSSPPPLDMSLLVDDTELSLTISPTDHLTALFDHITTAIRTAPRATDPSQPSWYEKMLMYEPVILEDLTTWLNSGQLTRIGFDGEVKQTDVKSWCESKSVCCLQKVTLRGKERKRS